MTIRLFEAVKIGMEAVSNIFDCPLYDKTERYKTVEAANVLQQVSMCHECTDKCRFVQGNRVTTIEREAVNQECLVFKHDHSNTYYSLNIYCMSHYSTITS